MNLSKASGSNTGSARIGNCAVCEEEAAGFHFGAFTCEGCKSFYGRTYRRAGSVEPCIANGECNVIGVNNRTSCKWCRLQKCYKVGMSRDRSRYGRRSAHFKQHVVGAMREGGDGDHHQPEAVSGAGGAEEEPGHNAVVEPQTSRTHPGQGPTGGSAGEASSDAARGVSGSPEEIPAGTSFQTCSAELKLWMHLTPKWRVKFFLQKQASLDLDPVIAPDTAQPLNLSSRR